MPTTDDLRAVLRDREDHAGDPARVLAALQHADAAPRRPVNRVLPLIAAAVVLAVALGVAVFASNRPHPHRAPVLEHSPAGYLHFGVRLAPLKGFTVDYDAIVADQQEISVRSTHGRIKGEVTVYPRGLFDPTTASGYGSALHGGSVTVNGRRGIYIGGSATGPTHPVPCPKPRVSPSGKTAGAKAICSTGGAPTLYWQYATNAWASLAGTLGSDRKAEALHIARSVRPGDGPAVRAAFAPHGLPTNLRAITAAGDKRLSTVEYTAPGATSNDAEPFRTAGVFRIERLSKTEAKVEGQAGRASTPHIARRALPDGGVLLVVVEQGFDGLVSPAVVSRVARETTVMPSMTKKSTWLRVPANATVNTTTTKPTPAYRHALVWSASMPASSGYTLTRFVDGQSAQEYMAKKAGKSYYITVYNPGAFDPKHPVGGGGPLYGKKVTVNGRPGVYNGHLFWQYAPNAWASQFGRALSLELAAAKALYVGTPVPATASFQVRRADLPSSVIPGYSAVTSGSAIVSYGATSNDPLFKGGSLDVMRGRHVAPTNPPADRAQTRKLSDGTTLLVSVPKQLFSLISAKQQAKILKDIDVSPKPNDPSTWLPIE